MRAVPPLLVLLVLGCGSDPAPADATSDVPVEIPDDPRAEDAAGDATPPGPCLDPADLSPASPPPAIGITRVEANPGVTVALYEDGLAIEQADRNAYLPARRASLVRAYVTLDAGWSPLEVEARLVLGGDCALVETMTPSSGSTPDDLDSTFDFLVPADEVVPGATWSVELSDPSGTPGSPTDGSRVPLSGTLDLGVEAGVHHMSVVLVPVDLASTECTALADTSPAHVQELHDAMFQQYPLETLDITVHAPLPWTGSLAESSGVSALLEAVMELRSSDGAPEDVFYYGLYDSCDACIDVTGEGDCLRGLAVGEGGFLPPSGRTRNAVGQAGTREPWTFVHETGHMQGRGHVECHSGPDPGGTDSLYPYTGGYIGAPGYGIVDGLLRDAGTYVDFMTICDEPTWISDYSWNAIFDRITSMSGG